MSNIATNYHKQAYAAQIMWEEFLASLTQEINCWRMFGILAEFDEFGSMCIDLRLHGRG